MAPAPQFSPFPLLVVGILLLIATAIALSWFFRRKTKPEDRGFTVVTPPPREDDSRRE